MTVLFPAPLGPRWVANCDIPDLELFPARYAGVRSVRFSAGVGLRITQFGTWAVTSASGGKPVDPADGPTPPVGKGEK